MTEPRIDRASPQLHPSLRAPRIGGGRGFSDELRPTAPERRGPPGLVRLAGEIADGAGPVGALVSAGIGAIGGDAHNRTGEFDQMWAMQAESRAANLEYLELQQAAQDENRRFTTASNLMKARHDTAKAAVSNIRV